MDTVGDRLKFLRKSCGITQTQLSEYLNISQGQIGRLERNTRNLHSKATIEKISELFNIDKEWLLYGEGECNLRQFKSNNIKHMNLNDIVVMNKIINNIEFLSDITRDL